MTLPDILKGTPHLPLKESTTKEEAIQLANGFYGTDLKEEDYKPSQAFWNTTGLLSLELISNESGEVKVTFANLNVKKPESPTTPVEDDEDDIWNLSNPLDTPELNQNLMAPPVHVNFADELVFLDQLGKGPVVYPVQGNDNSLAFELSKLLNNYQFLGRWVSGTMGSNSTGGFELIYKGPSKDAPEEFNLEASDMVAIIKIHHGETLGNLCLMT